MSMRLGTLIFSRHGSSRLPGKALRSVGGMPLLERVIRRARLLPWPAYLATTDTPADDPLVALAASLDVASFRGAEDRVLERAVRAAEAFGLDAFVRLCGDRPLFSLDDVRLAAATMQGVAAPEASPSPDLVTNCLGQRCPRGLTTEIVRTRTLRRILDGGVSTEQQEHLTRFFYDHAADFCIIGIPAPVGDFACPGFAVDTESDLVTLDRIFAASPALDLSPAQADRIYAP